MTTECRKASRHGVPRGMARAAAAVDAARAIPAEASRGRAGRAHAWRSIIALCLLFLGAGAARAQSVHWESSDSGDPSELQLIFQDCTPEGDPQLPRMEGVTMALVSTSSQATLNNFSLSRSTILLYRARAQRSGALQIPAFTVQTNQGSVRVPAFTGGSARSAAEANVFSRLEPGSRTVWAGEVFPLTYVLDVSRRAFNQLGTNIEWNPAPLVVEDWSKFEPSEAITNGETRLNVTSRTRGYAKSAGAVTLNAANQLVNLQSGSIGFGLFQTPRIEQLSVTSDRPALTVRPLPSPAPAGFGGAVGQFKLTSKVVPTSAGIGEPVTWTLELSGTGNWPDIGGLPQREVSKDFQVVQPQAKRAPVDGKLFEATLSEDVVLVPTRPGQYTVGPLNFVYFDPAAGTYKTITTPRTTLSITAPAAPPAPASGGATTADQPAAPATAAVPDRRATPPTVPAPPAAIPRDPLPGSLTSLVPFRERTVILLALIPFTAVPFYWFWLAIGRARQTDPMRGRREARRRLVDTIGEIRSLWSGSLDETRRAALRTKLLSWQHDTARLWELSHAAPSAEVFTRPLGTAKAAPTDELRVAWKQLWAEADRALYSAEAPLPADWPQRAEQAVAARTVPGFAPWRTFLPRNLLPIATALAVLCTLIPGAAGQVTRQGAADPSAAYQRGDFAAAEITWAAAVTRTPTDAHARHNLSLALAQQDRWGEAAAHAAAAVVQNPGHAAMRAQLALACEKAGYVPAPLVGFLPPGPLQSLAGNAAPSTWQLVLVAAAVVFCVGLGASLRTLYVRTSIWVVRGIRVVVLAASLLGMAATASLLAFGPVADRNAIIAWRASTLRSIPTEADTTQKTTPLPAGSVAIMDQNTFLGWVRLTFPNGQTGWVRKDDVIAIWR